MSTREKQIAARITMLALADELRNISRACKVAGLSRTHSYEIKEAFERCAREGLAPQPRRRPRIPNQTPPELETQILAMTREYRLQLREDRRVSSHQTEWRADAVALDALPRRRFVPARNETDQDRCL